MSIKAIETRYGGCRFRSRTEARWAVLFDALGIKWEYEREGFELPSGWYLPDFYVSTFQAWVEVKGSDPTDKEKSLAKELAEESDNPVLIVCGIPEEDSLQVFLAIPGAPICGPCFLASRGSAVTFPAKGGDRTYWLDLERRHLNGRAIPTKFLREAIVTARSARFEHGERG